MDEGQRGGQPAQPVGYVERLRPPWWLWLLAGLFVLSLAVAVFVPLGPVPALVTLGLAGGASVAGLVTSTPTIELSRGQLRAGRAHLPVDQLGPPVVLTGADARHARGPGFDPGAYYLLRGWLPDAVVVPVLDQEDPTPYWYLSSRSPQRLAAALQAAGATQGGSGHRPDAPEAGTPGPRRRTPDR